MLAALEHCRAADDDAGVAAALVGMGLCDPMRPEGNDAPVLDALETCERNGLFLGVVAALNALGEIARRSGRHAEAESRFRRALDLAGSLGAGHQRSIAATSLALALLDAGRVREAREQLSAALPVIEEQGHGALAVLAHAITIAILARLGSSRSLRHHLWAARTWVADHGVRADAETLSLLAAAQANAGLDALDAREIARLVLDAAPPIGRTVPLARTFFVRG